MHADEPNLLKHLTEARTRQIPEGGLSTILFCGKMTRGEGDSASVMSLHKGFVEEELGDHNNEEVNVTGLLMIQVSYLKCCRFLSDHVHFPGKFYSSLTRRTQFFCA